MRAPALQDLSDVGRPPPQGFTREQQEYLARVLMGLNLHKAFAPAAGTSAPVEEEVHGIPLEDLCKEELAKHREHALDIWARLEDWTKEDVMADGLHQTLVRNLGFFNVEPASQGYMMRPPAHAGEARRQGRDPQARGPIP